jgi:hypothetical protein
VKGKASRRLVFQFGIPGVFLLLCGVLVRAQDAPASTGSRSSTGGVTTDVRELADSIRELRDQVRVLNSELSELRAEEQQNHEESRALRVELERANRIAASPPSGAGETGTSASGEPLRGSSQTSTNPTASSGTPEDQEIAERVAKLEEDQQLVHSELEEQSQTKVEAASKYRVRLSGIALLSVFDNRGTVDDQEVPQIATPPQQFNSPGTFGGSLRQSQIGLEVFGPEFAGARTSANLKFDFAGGFPYTPNGVSMGLVRLRTGTIRMDWATTSIVAGQDKLFFAPLAPSSLASLAVPPLAYAGNLWGWVPQVRIEHRIDLPGSSNLNLEGGILDSLSGEAPQSGFERAPTSGEKSGQPAYAARVAWNVSAFGQDLTVGAGGYYGRQYWGFGRNVDGWAGTADLTLSLGRLLALTGEFYRGRAVGGLNGGIGQDLLISGPLATQATIVRGLDSAGGWAQLKFKPRANFEINGAVGEDSPFANELRRFPATQGVYGTLLSKNFSPFVNFIYQIRSDLLFSVEYRRLQTSILYDTTLQTANHVNLSLGYLF